MTNAPVENSGSFSDPSQAARLRDLLNGLIEDRVKTLSPTRMTGMVLDIYQGGPTFNSDITVDSTIIPRTQDNPERPYVAKIRLDDKFEGGIIEARIDPNLIPIFRKADFFDEENPAGSGTMVDRAGRYITVEVTDDGSAPVDDTYPSLIGTTLQAPQVAPRVALVGSAASWRVSELIRGVLAIQTNPATLMLGPDYARFDTNTLTWGGTIAFARGSEIKAYEIYPDAPIVTYGSEPLEVSITEPVEIVLGQRSGSMYLNFSATDGVPVLVWVEAGSDTPIPPEWYLVFARINDGDLSSKLVFSSLTDFRSPSAPDNLVLTYAKTGYEKLGLTASWNEVVEGTNGDPISISGYELWGELNNEDWRRITTTTDTHVAGLTFDSSSEWHFKVRAMGANGIPGVFSAVEAVTFPEETEVIGGGSKTYWQPDKPTEGNPGDEWFDTNDGNAHYIFDEVANDYVAAPFGSGALDEYVNNLINTAVSDAASASENAGLAITAANGKNTIFIQAAKPSLTGRVLGDTWFDTDDGNKIYSFDGADFVAGLLGTAAIDDAAITNAKIANLDAAKINTGSLDAARIAANSISVGKLVVADPENLWTNPFFNNAAATVAQITNKLATDAGVPAGCPYASCGARDNSRDTPANDYYTFRQGDSFYMEAYVCTDGTAVQPLNLGVHITNNDGTVNSWVCGPNAPAGTTTWTKISGIVTPDATNAAAAFPTATRMRALVQVEGTTGTDCQGWFVTNVQFRRANTSELIVDGSIIASKLAVGAITAGSAVIADGAIGNAQIASLQVDKLTGGTLQADISLAAKIEAGLASQGLVTLDATGIRVTDGSGIQQTAFNTTGQSVFKGDIEAAGIEAKGRVKLNAANNEIAVNASLTLAAGVTAPASAPQVTYTWNSFGVPAPTGALSWETSFSHHARGTDGKWYFYTYNYDVASWGILRFRVHRYSAALAWEAVVIDVTSNPPTVDGGVGYLTAIASTSVAVVNGVVWVPRIKMTRVSSTSYTLQHQLYSSGGASIDVGTAYTGYNPALGIYRMPTSYCIIGNASTTQVAMIFGQMGATAPTTQSIRLFNVSTGAITNSFTIADTASAAIIFGQFDYGADRYVITRDIDTDTYDWRIRTFTTAGVIEPARDFVVGGTTVLGGVANSLGISYYNGTFWTATGPGSTSNMMNVFQHSAITVSEVYAFSWYDSKSAGTGVHESAISPTFTASDIRYIRAIARVTTTQFAPDLTNDGVDKVRIYAGATEATLKVQVDSSVNQVDISTITTSGSAPGSNPDFGSASGNPALITNPAGTLLIKADGTIVGMIDAGALTTGTLAVARIPSLPAGQITSGTLAVAHIPSLPAGQITSGTFAAARLPAATESAIGAVELATLAEAIAGTDTTRAVTPAGLLAAMLSWPRFSASSTANTTINGWTRIVSLTEQYDSDNAYTPATGFYVTPEAGIYLLQAGLNFSSASTRRLIAIEQGTAAAGSNTALARCEGAATARSAMCVSRELQLAAGVSIAFCAYAAASTTLAGSESPTFFSVRRVA